DSEQLVKIFTENNRNIFGLNKPVIEEGAAACLTIFEPPTNYFFEEKAILSKSKNSPFIGKEMNGKVIGIINKNKLVLND
ncbi:MAG: dihydroorotase, partial [Ferruginibacter sp.]|nr:dihydroorotase [Ferruginibacter sp.]